MGAKHLKSSPTLTVRNLIVGLAIHGCCLLILGLFSCSPKSSLKDVNGDVSVRIPVSQTDDTQNTTYSMQTVVLKDLQNLKEVSGRFAHFIFAPGLNNNRLVGDAPQARFMKSSSGTYIAQDDLSLHMATLYFHLQKLSELNHILGLGAINAGPMSVGMQTRIAGDEIFRENNAFYDGKSDAILIVPFTRSELPIAVNSGIIAHEYFHSLFFKLVLAQLEKNKNTLPTSLAGISSETVHADLEWKNRRLQKASSTVSEKKTTEALINETLIRGLNEGLADFWGWAYSNDPNFIKWSLPGASSDRKLSLEAQDIGRYKDLQKISIKVRQAQADEIAFGVDPSLGLSGYIYEVGTPHARFLKTMSEMMAKENKEELQVTKIRMTKMVVEFLKSLSAQMNALKEKETLMPETMFQFIASDKSGLNLTRLQCEFVLEYLFNNPDLQTLKCKKQEDGRYLAK